MRVALSLNSRTGEMAMAAMGTHKIDRCNLKLHSTNERAWGLKAPVAKPDHLSAYMEEEKN